MNALIMWVALAAAVWLGFRIFEWKSIYYPRRRWRATPDAAGLAYEDVAFVAEDGCLLHGWWIPAERGRGTVIYCHGNASNIGDCVTVAAELTRMDVHVFLFDYRGYGRSRGFPTERGTYRDARAAYEVVRARYGDAEQPPVAVYGHSLGGAIAVQLALDKPVKGIALENAFTSIMDMGRALYPFLPVQWFCRYRYDNLAKMPGLSVPVIVSHSRQDDVTPFEMGRRLYDVAREPKEFFELSGGHNESNWERNPLYRQGLTGFLDRVLGPASPAQ